MNKKMLAITQVVLIFTSMFGMSACSSSSPSNNNTTTTASSKSSQAKSHNADYLVFQKDSTMQIRYDAYANDRTQSVEGKVVIKVGDWTWTNDENGKACSGVVTPLVTPGTYDAVMTYTNPQGGVLTSEFKYTLDRPVGTNLEYDNNSGPTNKPWIMKVKVSSSPLVKGTVSVVRDDNNTTIASADVGPDNTAILTIPPLKDKEVITTHVLFDGSKYNIPDNGLIVHLYGDSSKN